MPQQINDGDLTLQELFANLWNGRVLILGTTLIAALVSVGLAFVIPPVYEAKARLLPPVQGDIASMNLGRKAAGLWEFEVDQAYSFYTRILVSDTARRRLFDEVYLPSLTEEKRNSPRDELWDKFNEEFSIELPVQGPRRGERIVIAESRDPALAAQLVNSYMTIVDEISAEAFRASVVREVESELADVDRQIDVLRVTALNRREDRIARLEEAIQIARAVGLENPQVVPARTAAEGPISNFANGSQIYLLGSKALASEIKVLKARESDDPFISGLRDFKSRHQLLSLLVSHPLEPRLYTLDSAAEKPQTPVRPKKTLLVLIGTVLGGLLGMLIALVRQRRPVSA